MSTDTTRTDPSAARSTGRTVYSVLVGLTTLAILLQGVWAGIFLEHEGSRPDSWVNVHARGAEVSIGLAVLAFIAGVIWLRSRKDLLVGTGVLVVALVVEAYLGGRISDDGNDVLTVVHIPLAMAIIALAIWLPLRLRRRTD